MGWDRVKEREGVGVAMRGEIGIEREPDGWDGDCFWIG